MSLPAPLSPSTLEPVAEFHEILPADLLGHHLQLQRPQRLQHGLVHLPFHISRGQRM